MGFRQISSYLPEQVPANKFLFAGIVPANKFLFAGTVPANKFLFAGTVPANNLFLSLKNRSCPLPSNRRGRGALWALEPREVILKSQIWKI